MQRIALVLVVVLGSSITRADPAPPIIGGSRVAPGAWPDVVAVIGKLGTCSGTLIAPDVVLTAGHCADIEPSMVIANTIDYERPGPGERIAVKETRAYPDWEHTYDVAVVVLDHVAKPRPRAIATACLANRLLPRGALLQVLGFGLTTEAATDDNTALRVAAVPVLDSTCGSAPGCNPMVMPNGELAAGGRGTDSCFGDSGGPAMLATEHGPALVGVVSRGLALPGVPCGNGGIYVRADKVVAWVQAVTGRRLERVACGGPADDPEAEDDGGGGCSTGGQSSLAFGILALAAVTRRRR